MSHLQRDAVHIPAEWLNQQRTCPCGREHFVPIEAIIIDDDAATALIHDLQQRGATRVLVVDDANTHEAVGAAVLEELISHGFVANVYTFAERSGLLADESAIEGVSSAIRAWTPDVAVAVGSGVVNDVVRYATYEAGLPYVVFATAPSMDGYASTVAALQFAGVKTTLPAQSPRAIFAAPDVLRRAPWELLQAGFGDLVGKVISLLDWRLSAQLYGEYVCESAYALVEAPLLYCITHAPQLRERDPEAVTTLFTGLVASGVAMAMMGNSRPASGSEHHCSHFWDFLAYRDGREHASHGFQVGVATHWMARYYQLLDEIDSLRPPSSPDLTPAWKRDVEALYGNGAPEVLHAQSDKQAWLAKHAGAWPASPGAWERVREALAPLRRQLDAVHESLLAMEIPPLPPAERLQLHRETLRETFEHARELRARYTIFDFLEGQRRLETFTSRVMQLAPSN